MVVLNYSDKEAAIFWDMNYTALTGSTVTSPMLNMNYIPELSFGPASIIKVQKAYVDDIITTSIHVEVKDNDGVISESDASKFFYSSATE
jgi:hypothetical protein